MFSQVWAAVNNAVPVDIRLIFYGAICGLVIGSLKLGESIDEATALGIAVFVQVTIGVWSGLRLCRFWIQFVESRLNSLTGRLESLISQLNFGDGTVVDRNPVRPSSTWYIIVKWCIYMTPFWMVGITTGVILAAIDFRVNLATYDHYFMYTVASISLVVLCLVVQYINLWIMTRKVTRLEQHVNSGVPIKEFALHTDHLGSAFSNTDSFVYKVTGQRLVI